MDAEQTQRLLTELRESKSIYHYMNDNAPHLTNYVLSEYLEMLLVQRNIKKSDFVKSTNMVRGYAYEIFRGAKMPTRDKLIVISYAFPLDLEETQKLLVVAQYSPLYAKEKRDAVIIFSKMKNIPIPELNDLLFELELETLEY